MPRLPLIFLVVALLGTTVSAVLLFKIASAKQQLETELAGTTAREKNGTLQNNFAAATIELAVTREKLSSTELRIAVLDHDLAQANDKLSVYEQTARALSDEVASLKADLADTRATFASPEAVAAYKGTISELERQLANARNGAAAPTVAGASTAVFASRPGRAIVLTVGPSNAFVVLNFGSARGAQLGQKLEVSQGTDVVARVLISDVRTNFSIAQVQPETLRGVLQKGDLALLIR